MEVVRCDLFFRRFVLSNVMYYNYHINVDLEHKTAPTKNEIVL